MIKDVWFYVYHINLSILGRSAYLFSYYLEHFFIFLIKWGFSPKKISTFGDGSSSHQDLKQRRISGLLNFGTTMGHRYILTNIIKSRSAKEFLSPSNMYCLNGDRESTCQRHVAFVGKYRSLIHIYGIARARKRVVCLVYPSEQDHV